MILAVRPERTVLAAPGQGPLAGTIEQIVYEGTDTTYHVRLRAGRALSRLRAKPRRGPPALSPG